MKPDFSKFTDAASGSMTTAKAVLIFYPLQENASSSLDQVKDAAAESKEKLTKLQNKVKAAADQAVDLPKTLQQEKMSEPVQSKEGEGGRVSFQFNPAALHIKAAGDGIAPVAAYGSGQGKSAGSQAGNDCDQVEFGTNNEKVTVSFKVVFDALKNQRAFLTDAVNTSPTGLVRQSVNLRESAVYTVRPLAEGFLAAIRDSGARRIVFQWGSMRYGGYLNKAQCRYTMFDIEGEAVRAEIDLSLVCSCHNYYDIKEWQERYNAFMQNRDMEFRLQDHAWRSAFAASAGIGRVEKACILFHAPSVSANGKTNIKPNAKPETGQEAGKGTDTNKEADKGQEAYAAALAQMAKVIRKAAKGEEKAKKSDQTKQETMKKMPDPNAAVKAAGYIPVRICYNPASVTIESKETAQQDGDTAASSQDGSKQRNAMPMETELSMDLFFDETNNANAFMLDSGMGSPTGAVKAGIHLKSKMAGREYSVAPISELFVAASMFAHSRPVCFVWNKMVFWGELSEVDVEYTMFNNRGNPIRSKVSIRISQSMGAAQTGDFEKRWKKAFHKLQEEAEKLANNRGLTASSGNYVASNLFRM